MKLAPVKELYRRLSVKGKSIYSITLKLKEMKRLLKELNVVWNDKRTELSNEVLHKEKQAIVAEMAKNEQVNNLSIF